MNNKKEKITANDIILGLAPIWVSIAGTCIINIVYMFI